MSCLLLNSDAAPVSLIPLSVIDWRKAIKHLVEETATTLEWHDQWIVHSQRWSTPVPAVMILKEYQRPKTTIRFSKQNIFLRDQYLCQYCNAPVTSRTATLDHVLPASYGGRTAWDNCTTSCGPCNARKGNNRKIVPLRKPWKPSYFQLAEIRKKMHWDLQHPSWISYIDY